MAAAVLGYLRRHHLALLALFVALGGTTYAVNRVGSNQIRNNGVRSIDLRNNGVRSIDLRRGAVRSVDVADGSLIGADIDQRTLGFPRTIHRAQGGGSITFGTTGAGAPIPLDGGSASYAQAAGELNLFYGSLTAVFPDTCTAPRSASIQLRIGGVTVARGRVESSSSVEQTLALPLGPTGSDGFPLSLAPPTSATQRTIDLRAFRTCDNGGQVRVGRARVFVIGIR